MFSPYVESDVHAAKPESYIGAKSCGECHIFEYQKWKSGPHANALTLLAENQKSDTKCSSCHTMVPVVQTSELMGVQCESCHGPGKYYHPEYVMRDQELARIVGLVEPNAQSCQQCHTEGAPRITPFDFAAMWAKIDHGPDARKKWEQAQRAAAKSVDQD